MMCVGATATYSLLEEVCASSGTYRLDYEWICTHAAQYLDTVLHIVEIQS